MNWLSPWKRLSCGALGSICPNHYTDRCTLWVLPPFVPSLFQVFRFFSSKYRFHLNVCFSITQPICCESIEVFRFFLWDLSRVHSFLENVFVAVKLISFIKQQQFIWAIWFKVWGGHHCLRNLCSKIKLGPFHFRVTPQDDLLFLKVWPFQLRLQLDIPHTLRHPFCAFLCFPPKHL